MKLIQGQWVGQFARKKDGIGFADSKQLDAWIAIVRSKLEGRPSMITLFRLCNVRLSDKRKIINCTAL
jgi:hypothetical protein